MAKELGNDLEELYQQYFDAADTENTANEYDALDETERVYGKREDQVQPFGVSAPEEKDYKLNTDLTNKYFNVVTPEEEKEREKGVMNAEWVGRLGQAAAALGNAYLVGKGSVNMKIPELQTPDLMTWKNELANRRLKASQYAQGQQQAYDKAVSNWMNLKNQHELRNIRRLEQWDKAFKDAKNARQKISDSKLKGILQVIKEMRADKRAEEANKTRLKVAGIGAASRERSHANKYNFRGKSYATKDEYEAAIKREYLKEHDEKDLFYKVGAKRYKKTASDLRAELEKD